MPNVLFIIDSQGTALAQLGVCCGARLQGVSQDSPPFFGTGVPLIWSSGDLGAGMGSSQIPRNSLRSPTWEISLGCMGHLDLQVGRAPALPEGSGGWAGAGLDAHHLWACLSFNISLTDRNLGHPGCFSSFYPLPVPHVHLQRSPSGEKLCFGLCCDAPERAAVPLRDASILSESPSSSLLLTSHHSPLASIT